MMKVRMLYTLIEECANEAAALLKSMPKAKSDAQIAGILLTYTFMNPDIFTSYELGGRNELKRLLMNFIKNYIKVEHMVAYNDC